MRTRSTILHPVLSLAFAFVMLFGSAPWSTPLAAQESADGIYVEEIAGLKFMREEEKLARDVYLTLDESWNLRVFENISRAEQTHMDRVKTLLDSYEIEDPAAGRPVGSVVNPDLQALYNQLIDEGSRSLADALRVGAAIEEIDILDLQQRLAQTGNEDIRRVYANLLRGSGNHLLAFVSILKLRSQETYEPQFMDQATYDDIMAGNRNGEDGYHEGIRRSQQLGQRGGQGGDHRRSRWAAQP